jgi:hypothetical protein
MRILTTILIMTLYVSCSTPGRDEKRLRAWSKWKARTTTEIKEHPYFEHLTPKIINHDNKIQTWVFLDQSKFQSDSYCQSIGGCRGIPVYNCENAFSIKNDLVLGFEQRGVCPGIKTIEPLRRERKHD